jgi:transposase-like protein
MKTINPKFVVAVEEYKSGQFSNQALAARHGVSPSTIHYWIRRAGAPRKPRGPRPLEEPSPMQRQMIELSAALTGREVARRFGVSPQRVHQVLHRWEHLRPQRPEPVKSAAEQKPKKRRELRREIVSFRLTAPQADRVRATLRTWGLGNRFSNGAACRAVLLAALGVGKFQLADGGISVDQTFNDARDLAVSP